MDSYRIMEIPDGVIVKTSSFMLNCHVCGKTFSPLSVTIMPSPTKKYFLGTYSRMCAILIDDESMSKVCEHIKNDQLIWIYDPKDDMQGKKIEKESNEKNNLD